MSKPYCVKWDVVPNLRLPALELEFTHKSTIELSVRVLFYGPVNGLSDSLTISFPHAIAAQWEQDNVGLISLPKSLPRCSAPEWRRHAYALLQMQSSPWLAAHQQSTGASIGTEHFVFASSFDILHVIARPDATTKWHASRS